MMLGAIVLGSALLVVSCRGEPDAPRGPAPGTERGACRPDRACEPGLICLSDLCVRPPPADCQAIADQLASMELGNYAPVEERAPVVARYRAACDQGRVSKEQGACVEQAKDRWAVAQCAPSMFPELASTEAVACGPIAEKLRATMSAELGSVPDPQMQQMLTAAVAIVKQSCEQDAWPDLLKRCVLFAGDTTDALTACNAQMPPGLQQKLADRMMQAMQAP